MFKRFKKEEKKDKIDILTLTRNERIKLIAKFCLKWGLIILLPEIIIMILIDRYTDFIGNYFFGYQLFLIPGALLIIYPICLAMTKFLRFSQGRQWLFS